jgi:hypothetical protein
MARAESDGIGYFPIVTEWDQKIKLVRAKYKLLGVGCIVELWKAIYSEGYALIWDEDAELLFADENNIDLETLHEIVNFAVEKGIFDKTQLVDNHVLTSHGIQKQWLAIVSGAHRKNIEIDPKLCLLSAEERPSGKVETNDSGRVENSGGNDADVPKSTEEVHKAKQSKANKIIKELAAAAPVDNSKPKDKDFFAFCLGLAEERKSKSKKPIADLEAYVRSLMTQPDVIADFEASRNKPPEKSPDPPSAPDPGPCSCGGEIWADRPAGEGICKKCGKGHTYDWKLGKWEEDKPVKIDLRNTG